MYVSPRNNKAYGCPCYICNKILTYGDQIEVVKTKSITVNKVKIPGKTFYLHTKCIRKNK